MIYHILLLIKRDWQKYLKLTSEIRLYFTLSIKNVGSFVLYLSRRPKYLHFIWKQEKCLVGISPPSQHYFDHEERSPSSVLNFHSTNAAELPATLPQCTRQPTNVAETDGSFDLSKSVLHWVLNSRILQLRLSNSSMKNLIG